MAALSDEGRFTHAYDAALLLCKLALHASGFKLQKGKGHHAYWINSLEFTLGKAQKDTLIHLSKSSHLRHISLYDQTGAVEKQDAEKKSDSRGNKSETEWRVKLLLLKNRTEKYSGRVV